jgi:hypothetical protein
LNGCMPPSTRLIGLLVCSLPAHFTFSARGAMVLDGFSSTVPTIYRMKMIRNLPSDVKFDRRENLSCPLTAVPLAPVVELAIESSTARYRGNGTLHLYR